jgi:hypothetical protein
MIEKRPLFDTWGDIITAKMGLSRKSHRMSWRFSGILKGHFGA